MTDIETKIQDEDLAEELSDEALDREGARICGCHMTNM